MKPLELLAVAALVATGIIDPSGGRGIVASMFGLSDGFSRAQKLRRVSLARFMKETGKAMPAWVAEFWPSIVPVPLQKDVPGDSVDER